MMRVASRANVPLKLDRQSPEMISHKCRTRGKLFQNVRKLHRRRYTKE